MKKFVQVQEYPLDMTNEELANLLRPLKDAEVMRTLIMAEVAAIRAGAERELRTMRNLWYDYIKLVLSRAGLLKNKTRTGKDKRWDKLLSVYLAEMVRGGLTSYLELRIVDSSRQRCVATPITRTMVDVSLVGDHFPWLILFTEKDTIWEEILSVAGLYGISAISGGGEPSNACTHNVTEEILSKTEHDLVLLSFTDYDPYGYTIAQAQFAQIQEAAGGRKVIHERLGLLPEQLTIEERRAKSYEPADKGLKEWYGETGGVDGQPLGLELDALSLSRLRDLCAIGIERYVDLDRRIHDLHEGLVDLLVCRFLLLDFEKNRAKMKEAIKESDLWETIVTTPIPPNLFRLAARAGWNDIDPTSTSIDSKPLFGCQNEILQIISEFGGEYG